MSLLNNGEGPLETACHTVCLYFCNYIGLEDATASSRSHSHINEFETLSYGNKCEMPRCSNYHLKFQVSSRVIGVSSLTYVLTSDVVSPLMFE
ncbi:hypothetical protein P8452_60271 [Trifolium repens]|nr:hypothetical protein P8452_60271 [Trifolium repens]